MPHGSNELALDEPVLHSLLRQGLGAGNSFVTIDHDSKLSNEVAVSIGVTDCAVNASFKSRAVSGLDRLVGSLFEWPAARLEASTDKIRLKAAIQAQLARDAADALSNSGGDQAFLRDLLGREVGKAANRSAVAVEALEAMKALPSPDGTMDPKDPPEQSDRIDDDWMNAFLRFAEDASSERMQGLWGRVLAGESQRSGSYSRQALRFISELDQSTAEHCEWIAQYCVDGVVSFRPDELENETLLKLLDLQRLGLLEGVGLIGLESSLPIGPDGYAYCEQANKGLLFYGAEGTSIKRGTIFVTRLGREVLSLLPPNNEGAGLLRLWQLNKDEAAITKVQIGDLAASNGDQRSLVNLQTLYIQSDGSEV